MNIRQLQAFCAVMEKGSISEAARALHISQPAVTKSIRFLEGVFQIELFKRTGGRIYPSIEAQKLYPTVKRIFEDLKAVDRLAEELRRGQAGRLRIAASFTLAAAFVPETIRAFHESRALVDIRFMALPPRQVIELVAAHEIDLGILYEPIQSAKLHRVPLCSAEIVCALPVGHHFEERATVRATDLVGHTVISFSESSYAGGLLKKTCEAAGVPWSVAIEVNQTAAALSMVEAGTAIAVVDPFALAGSRSDRLSIKSFRPRTTLHSHAIYATDRPVSPLYEEFIETLAQVVRRHADRTPQFLRPSA